MRALTLHQPWADMVARSHKSFETRSWKTNYRGIMAIHASQNRDFMNLYFEEPFITLYGGYAKVREADFSGNLSHGLIVALVNLVDIKPAEVVRQFLLKAASNAPSQELRNAAENELLLGDYSDGRWAWQLEHLLAWECGAPTGIIRGYQHLWTVGASVEIVLRDFAKPVNLTW